MIHTICICGAGTMGSGIAQTAAMAGYRTLLYDLDPEVLANGSKQIARSLETLETKGRMTSEQKEQALARLIPITNIEEAKADLIIEAIVEKMEAKVALFQNLTAINSQETILASNTSSLSITTLAEHIPNPERVAGMHFFNPAPVMKLVEVVAAKQTSQPTLDAIIEVAKQCGKTPVLCKDAPGFIVNHVARPYYLEALRLVEAGHADIETVDVLMESIGFKMGPFKLMDLIGNDINYAVSCSVYEAMDRPERLEPSKLQAEKVKQGALGKKSGLGYYHYPPTPPNTFNASLSPVFVTGGTGFLGAYIIKALIEKGYKVRAIKRSTSQIPFFISPGIMHQVEWIEGDILDPIGLVDAMQGAGAVIHAAAKVSFAKEDKKELFQTNIDGTANVVNAAIETATRRFVHISSVASLGRTANGEQVTEDKKWEESKLNTTYAISKFRGELEVWRGIGEGLEGVVLNPSTILGFGDWNTSSSAIFKSVYEQFPWYSEGINGFVDVADVAAAAVAMMESNITGQRFILNGDNWSFHKLFDTIAKEFKVKLPTREATPTLGAIAWRMEKLRSMFSGKRPLLTKDSARVAQSRTFFDASLIRQKLPGFTFTPLETTIRNACGLYLATQSIAVSA